MTAIPCADITHSISGLNLSFRRLDWFTIYRRLAIAFSPEKCACFTAHPASCHQPRTVEKQFTKPKLSLSDPSSDFTISDETISLRHCRLTIITNNGGR